MNLLYLPALSGAMQQSPTGDKEALIYYKMVEPYIKDSKTKLFVKYCNYVPVATASVILNKGNTAGIYDIITHPEFRCRGFGTSITKFALNYIKEQGYKYFKPRRKVYQCI